MTPDFAKAQDAATALLLEQTLCGLYFDVRSFRLGRRIHIDTIQNYSRLTGVAPEELICSQSSESMTLRTQKGTHLILYNDETENERRKHWGIAHEVGHVYLGHRTDGEAQEKEAHFFAAQLYMPEIALLYMAKLKKSLEPGDIVRHFNASYTSAQNRLATLRRKRAFALGPQDRALLERLKPFIRRAVFPPRVAARPLNEPYYPFDTKEEMLAFLRAEEQYLFPD